MAGAGRSFGEVVEWRIDRGGVPLAAIIRTWRTDQNDRTVQELQVLAINAGVACIHAVVPANALDANTLAAAQGESAARWQCTEE